MVRVLLGAALASSLLSSGVKQNQELSVWKTLLLPFRYLFLAPKSKPKNINKRNFDTKNLETPVCTLRTLPAKFVITVGFFFLTENPPAAGIGCFKCVSVNGSLPACEDQFHNNKTDMVSRKQSGRYLKHIFNSQLEVSPIFNCSCQRHLPHNIRWQSHKFVRSWVKIDFWVL